MKKNYHRLIIFLAMMGIGFSFAFLYLSWPLLTGKTYVLSTQPVDPFDVLRGQYITIGYTIGNLPNSLALADSDIGKYIYVYLQKDSSGIYSSKGVSLEKPQGEDFIRGKIKSVSESSIGIEYGIEQFFFERDASFSTRNMNVEVKVSASGEARISRLLKDGKPLDIVYKEVKLIS